ncbi:MAG: hypothetical protein HQL80_12000 [Magnetococcales bacterium]|nr:hypothetical protein [Magnetococcales bacterium]
MGRPRKIKQEGMQESTTEDAMVQGSILDQTDEAPVIIGAGQVEHEVINPYDDVVLATKENMLGDFVKVMVDKIKAMPTPWGKMTAQEREDLVTGIKFGAQAMITKAAEDIAANGRRIVTGVMKQVAIKDEITATIVCSRSPEACAAFGMSSGGGPVAFLLLDTESLLTDAKPLQVGPGQKNLPFDDGDISEEEMTDNLTAFLGVQPVEIQTQADGCDPVDYEGCPL